MEPHLPPEQQRPQNEDIGGHTQRKLPEFIVIEDNGFKRDPLSEGIKRIKPVKVPLKVRFLCFLIGALTLLWTFGAFCCFLVTSIFALVFALQVDALNRMVKLYWRYVKAGSAVTTGLFIAIFSPYLGFILIFSYFLLQDPTWQRGMLANLVRSQFGDYLS